MDATGLSTFEQLRRRRHQRWLEQLQLNLAAALGDLPCRVWLFDPSDSRQALATASAVLAWVEQLDRDIRS